LTGAFRQRFRLLLGVPALTLALWSVGCAQDISLTVRAGDRPPTPEFVLSPPREALVVAGGTQIDSFQIVLRDIRLQSNPTDAGEPTADIFFVGSGTRVVTLSGSSLSPGAQTRIISGVHIGAKGYYEMDITLRPVTPGEAAADATLAALLNRTFIIQGHSAGGSPFTFESALEQTLLRESVFRMGLNHNNLDLNIAPGRWFETPDGGVLDPTSSDPAVRSLIESNVAGSIDGYQDDNFDGVPDPLG
jgi:hypothetical protein